MLKEKVQVALNHQINSELYSWYLYLSMSAYFENENWSGFAKWMKVQAEEEYTHAMKFFDYVLQTGGKINLTQITAPKANWNSVLDVFQDTLSHEQEVTKSIYNIVELSAAEKDHATSIFLQWFVNEQVEEESTVEKILTKIKMGGDNKNALIFLDRELGMRASK
jgi:ferritin